MAFSTANDIIGFILKKLGVIGQGETPSAADADDAFTTLNLMLATWGSKRLLSQAPTLLNFPLVAGTSAYSIGSGQTFNTSSVPLSINSAFYEDSTDEEYPMDVKTREEWDLIGDKLITTGPPTYLFFDPGATQQTGFKGTINIYPIPDSESTYTLYMEALMAFTEFATLTTAYNFPPIYQEAIAYNAMERCASMFGKVLAPSDAAIARRSYADIVAINAANNMPITRLDLPGMKGPGSGNILNFGVTR